MIRRLCVRGWLVRDQCGTEDKIWALNHRKVVMHVSPCNIECIEKRPKTCLYRIHVDQYHRNAEVRSPFEHLLF